MFPHTCSNGFCLYSFIFFAGLDALHEMTTSKNYELRADITDWAGLTGHVTHASISVADETDFYRLAVGAITDGDAGRSYLCY